MIQWIFFDIGNVILNDDPAMVRIYTSIHELLNQNGMKVTFEELLRLREKLIIEEHDGRHFDTVGRHYLGDSRWPIEFHRIRKELTNDWARLSPLLQGVVPVIRNLHDNFKLGLIANQPREVLNVLEGHQLLSCFDVRAISGDIGLRKPDSKIFEYALNAAGCIASEAIMIGDRIDNDIIPAKRLGMRTIRLALPLHAKGYAPVTAYEKMYFESIERASASRLTPLTSSEEPDFTARFFMDIPDGVKYIVENSH